MTQPAPPREDIFVSVCLDFIPAAPGTPPALLRLVTALASRFRYWEVLIAIPPDLALTHEDRLAQIGNIRLLKIRNGAPFYRRRAAVAAEAIGDCVALSSIDELDAFDLPEMIETAADSATIIVGRNTQISWVSPILGILGKCAGFRVSAEDMLTTVYPRTLLNQLLAHPNRQLALRFAPSDSSIPVEYEFSSIPVTERSIREFPRRLNLIQRLLISSAPTVLTLVALLALLTTFAAISFTAYAIIVWLTFEKVQAGWFTTSLVLSLTAAFLGTAIFGVTIGIHNLIEASPTGLVDDIVGERAVVERFEPVMQELNVSVESDSQRSAGPHTHAS